MTEILANEELDRRDRWGQVFVLVHDELRTLAGSALESERSGRRTSVTELVNDAYVRLVSGTMESPSDRLRFYALAAKAMRNIMIDRARSRRTLKRGAGRAVQSLNFDPAGTVHHESLSEDDAAMIRRALEDLATHAPREAELYNLTRFAGRSLREIAGLMGLSEDQAKRRYRYAVAWLTRRIKDDVGDA